MVGCQQVGGPVMQSGLGQWRVGCCQHPAQEQMAGDLLLVMHPGVVMQPGVLQRVGCCACGHHPQGLLQVVAMVLVVEVQVWMLMVCY